MPIVLRWPLLLSPSGSVCAIYCIYIYILCCIECLLCCGGPYYCLPAVLCVLYTVCRLQIFTQEDPQLEIYIMLGWLFSLGSYIGTVSGDRPFLGISLFGNFPWIIPVLIRYVLPACLKQFLTFVLGFTRLAHLHGLEIKMLFSRSEGHKFKPLRGTLLKDLRTFTLHGDPDVI